VEIALPPTLTAALSQGGAPPALKPGDVVTARVLQILSDGMARLSLANMMIDLPTEIELTPGTTIQLAVAGTPSNLKLVLVEQGAGLAKGQAVQAPVQQSGVTPPVPSTSGTVRAEPAVALSTALRSAAVRQDSLAPLFADLAAAAETDALPQPVRQAVTRLLSFQVPASTVSAADVKQAFARSGVLMEAKLAAASSAGPAPGATPAAPAADLKAALLVFRQVLKTWVDAAPAAKPEGTAPSPALASAPQPGGIPATTKPSPLQVAVEPEVLAQTRASTLASVPAQAIEELPAADARVVRTLPLPGNPGAVIRPAGLPAMPLREAILQAEPGKLPLPASVPAGVEKPVPANAPNIPNAPNAPNAPAPPPYRGGPLAAQPPAAPSIVSETDPRMLGERLLEETDSALSRQTLLQGASLPESGSRARDTQASRWNFEIPLATPQGTAIAQFEIARDGRGTAEEQRSAPVWRVRFTLDVEPIGPVHAQIALAGGKTSVALWAERAESAVRLRKDTAQLSAALREAELEPGDVLVRLGEPPRPPEPGAGRFLDRAS
jgi:hypothetical protein